jgi:putative ABC transport system permease protein
MFDLDKWQEILNSIRRHKLRTTLTALGVFWGIFMLVLLLGAGNGLQNGVEHMFRDDATNSIWIRRGVTSEEYKGLPKGRRIQFFNDDYDYLVKNVKEVEHITGRLYLSGDRTVTYGDKNLSFSIRSVHPGHKFLENTIMIKGRYLNETDLKEVRKVAVIGKIVKESLFGEEEAIGKEINIGGIVYKVIGVYRDTGGENEMRNIYLPITTAQKVYTGTEEIHQLMFTAGDLPLEEMKKLEDEVRAIFAQRHQNQQPTTEQLKCAPRNFMPLKSGGLKAVEQPTTDNILPQSKIIFQKSNILLRATPWVARSSGIKTKRIRMRYAASWTI